MEYLIDTGPRPRAQAKSQSTKLGQVTLMALAATGAAGAVLTVLSLFGF